MLMTNFDNVTRRFPARLEATRQLGELAVSAAQAAQFDESAVFQTRLAMDEACTNIIEHAYPNSDRGEIEVMLEAQPGELRIHLTDFGEAYDPREVRSEPHTGSRLEEAHPGGLGLYLMRRVMDEVYYISHGQHNTLVMVKRQ
jgi:serine/threonine-protein kinase RsbW